MLLPRSGGNVPGIPAVILDSPLPARNSLVRAIGAKLNLADQLPAILTAPETARLIVDRRRGIIWFDGVQITELKPDTHQFKFAEILVERAPAAVPKDDVVRHLSYGRADGDQAARAAKMRANKVIREALEAAGHTFEDPFLSGNGCYRLTVRGHML